MRQMIGTQTCGDRWGGNLWLRPELLRQRVHRAKAVCRLGVHRQPVSRWGRQLLAPDLRATEPLRAQGILSYAQLAYLGDRLLAAG